MVSLSQTGVTHATTSVPAVPAYCRNYPSPAHWLSCLKAGMGPHFGIGLGAIIGVALAATVLFLLSRPSRRMRLAR